MAIHFDLIVTADTPTRTVELRLLDAAGTQLAYQQLDFTTLPLSDIQGLFNLREHVRRYAANPGEAGRSAEQMVADLGAFLAERVMGRDIFAALAQSASSRTLRVQLPQAQEEGNHLAAAIARVPWEIARAAADMPTLGERNLVVRAVHGPDPAETETLELEPDEALRVLFVFAEAKGSSALNARQERHDLLALFRNEIYPKRRIEADFLAHGVTRERLTDLIETRRGYHLIHWSGHGHLNLLELARANGQKDRLSGEELVELLTRAGGFIPRLFFLSACHSGDVLDINDWQSFQAALAGNVVGARGAETGLTHSLEAHPGFTGTAHALLRAGVPSVVAMRYAVGDAYARDLAVDFYQGILADPNPKSVAEALNQARKKLQLSEKSSSQPRYAACDHATPVLYGLADPELPVTKLSGRSAYQSPRDPRLGPPLSELNIKEHPHFVGRTWELAGLGAEFIGHDTAGSARPVALIQGLGGMGKTALAAEVMDLWKAQFQWVLLFQAKPNALNFDNSLRDIHLGLYGELKAYHYHVKENPADAIWRSADTDFRGDDRTDRLIRNLLRAMRDEAILIVLDNFETHLKPKRGTDAIATVGDGLWTCQDPAWDRLLTLLAKDLPGTASRLLITCRHPLAALTADTCHACVLGPLSPAEGVLFLQSHPHLRALATSPVLADNLLARRILHASRFHPLLLDRLARLLAGGTALRGQLDDALSALEKTREYSKLPEFLAARSGETKDVNGKGNAALELAYLNDALQTSIDLLLHQAGADARRLLWIIALANDPEALGLVRVVWEAGGSALDVGDLSPAVQNAGAPKIEAPLQHLIAVGLVTAERDAPEDENPNLTCHELVRERCIVWMQTHPTEHMGQDGNGILLAYARHMEVVFHGLINKDMNTALECGRRALVYCVQASAWEQLGGFVNRLVTRTTDPSLFRSILPQLEMAAHAAPEGELRVRCLCALADALDGANQSVASLRYYEQAASAARASGNLSHLAAIMCNWAVSLYKIGHYDESRAKRMESAEVLRKVGNRLMDVIGCELEVYRIDIEQGRMAAALPEVEQRVALVEQLWWQIQQGKPVPDALDPQDLANALISALNIAMVGHFAMKDWPAALRRVDAVLAVKRALQRPAMDIARDCVNRAVVLKNLHRYSDAQDELESCLLIFADEPISLAMTRDALASLLSRQGDSERAVELERRALAIFEQHPNPQARATSHGNLGAYLEASKTASALSECVLHQYAALVYLVAAGLTKDLQKILSFYTIDFRHEMVSGIHLAVPRLADLCALPAFRPLAQWLDEHGHDREILQQALDHYLAQARQAGEAGN